MTTVTIAKQEEWDKYMGKLPSGNKTTMKTGFSVDAKIFGFNIWSKLDSERTIADEPFGKAPSGAAKNPSKETWHMIPNSISNVIINGNITITRNIITGPNTTITIKKNKKLIIQGSIANRGEIINNGNLTNNKNIFLFNGITNNGIMENYIAEGDEQKTPLRPIKIFHFYTSRDDRNFRYPYFYNRNGAIYSQTGKVMFMDIKGNEVIKNKTGRAPGTTQTDTDLAEVVVVVKKKDESTTIKKNTDTLVFNDKGVYVSGKVKKGSEIYKDNDLIIPDQLELVVEDGGKLFLRGKNKLTIQKGGKLTINGEFSGDLIDENLQGSLNIDYILNYDYTLKKELIIEKGKTLTIKDKTKLYINDKKLTIKKGGNIDIKGTVIGDIFDEYLEGGNLDKDYTVPFDYTIKTKNLIVKNKILTIKKGRILKVKEEYELIIGADGELILNGSFSGKLRIKKGGKFTGPSEKVTGDIINENLESGSLDGNYKLIYDYTLQNDLTIPKGKTLTILENKILFIKAGKKLTIDKGGFLNINDGKGLIFGTIEDKNLQNGTLDEDYTIPVNYTLDNNLILTNKKKLTIPKNKILIMKKGNSLRIEKGSQLLITGDFFGDLIDKNLEGESDDYTVPFNYTLKNDLTIPNGKTLTIKKGYKLTIPNEEKLTIKKGGKFIGDISGNFIDKNLEGKTLKANVKLYSDYTLKNDFIIEKGMTLTIRKGNTLT